MRTPTLLAVLSVVVASGCKSKPEDAPPPPQAAATTLPYAPPPTQDRAAHLKRIEVDLAEAEAARKANPLAPFGEACARAKSSLVFVLSQEDPKILAPINARFEAACSEIAVERLSLPADLVAPAKAVQDAMPGIDTTYRARDYATAATRCQELVAPMDKVHTSTIREMRSLWSKADSRCNLLVPVATIEAAIDAGSCTEARVKDAHAVLVRSGRLGSPAVAPLLEKFNQTCPDNLLATK